MTVFKVLVSFFAMILIVLGLITAITPVPFGLPMVIIGILLLATISPLTLRLIRRRWGWLDRRLRWVQETFPNWMTRALKRTDPERHDQNDDESNEGQDADGNKKGEPEGPDPEPPAARLANMIRRQP